MISRNSPLFSAVLARGCRSGFCGGYVVQERVASTPQHGLRGVSAEMLPQGFGGRMTDLGTGDESPPYNRGAPIVLYVAPRLFKENGLA